MSAAGNPITVELGALPVWHGVQDSPEMRSAPFSLTLDERGLVRLLSPETVARTVQGYGADGYRFPTQPPGSSEWGDNLAKRSLDGLAETTGGLDGLDVMEIGGGTLYCARHMLEEMGARGVTLVDPAAREEPDDDRLRVRREYFTEETAIERQHELIVTFNTLEHVPDPESFLRAAHGHLSDGGRIFIKVPDCEHSLARGDLGMCTHEHLTYFTPDSLDLLLRRTGFECIAEANYLGALQVLARKAPVEPAACCLSSVALLAGFGEAAGAHLERLRALGRTNRGAPTAFIGASVGLSNVLHVSCIAESLDVEIYDGDPQKTGKFMPGFSKPILHTSDSRLESHRHLLIIPVNFFDEIRAGLAGRPGLADARIDQVFP